MGNSQNRRHRESTDEARRERGIDGEHGDETEARASALRWLARREYAVAELQRRLLHKGHPYPIVERVVADLASSNLVSDERYVEALVHARVQREVGPLKIIAQLREAGVDEGLIAASVDVNAGQWIERAKRLWQRRFQTSCNAHVDETLRYKAWGKQARFLSQRGYTPAQVRAAIGEPAD